MSSLLYILASLLLGVVLAQKTRTGVHTVTPREVAFLSRNVTGHQRAPFQLYHPSFSKILGRNASLTLLLKDDLPLFHEVGVYVEEPSGPALYATSNQFDSPSSSPSTNNKSIVISRITQNAQTGKWSAERITPEPGIPLPNGGAFYDNGIVFTAQGNLERAGGLTYMKLPLRGNDMARPPRYTTRKLLDNYLGQEFNSPNDVFVLPASSSASSSSGSDGTTLIFTDPPYGFAQDIRPPPALPGQVYAFTPGTTNIRVVAAGTLSRPNGVTLSPDLRTAYIADAVGETGDGRPRIIYAYDVTPTGSLTNQRVFAQPAVGIPDGVKTDAEGNVYAGCGDGVNVWDPTGRLLGKIVVGGGVANFAIAEGGRMFLFNEERLWLAKVDERVRPAVVNRLGGT